MKAFFVAVCAAALALCLVGSTAGAQAVGGGLFLTGGAEVAAAAADLNPQGPIARRRYAAIDTTYLSRIVGANTDTVTLNLMPDVNVIVTKLEAGVDELGNLVWRGASADGAATATLVIHDAQVTGEVHAGGQRYGIAPVTGGTGAHAIVEYRSGGQWRKSDVAARPPVPAKSAGAHGASLGIEHPAATPSFSVYIAYTAAALKLAPDMQGAISLALADLRTTLANSQIAATVTLAGSVQTTYTEAANASSDAVLNDAQIGAGDFARVRQLQKTAGADILSVWSAYNDNCGLAGGMFYQGNPASVDLAAAATASVNTISADCGASTFTHEVGHLFGADHERYIIPDAVPGPAGYNYGYTDLGHFRDVMAYGNECDDKGQPCAEIQYFSNPNLTYQGRPIGIADALPAAADNSRRITETLPYVAQLHANFSLSTIPVLSVSLAGRGTVTTAGGEISCGTTCSAAITSGTRVTLTAIADPGWDFGGWSGSACSGAALTCAVSVTASMAVTATFTQSAVVQIGGIYSSAQAASQSFLRLFNTSASAATATVSLRDGSTGTVLGRWTSPSIGAGVERQFAISEIESGATPAVTTKPQFYTVSIAAQFTGSVQHVLWHVSDSSLTNLTTCSSGAKAEGNRLIGVHSSLLGAGYPSSVVVYNATTRATTVTLGVYDALTATRLGTFTTDSVPGNGERIYTVAAIEQAAQIAPSGNMYHYVVKAETALTGHIAHLMTNVQAGVVTDMSAVCPLGSAAAVAATSTVRQASIFSSAQAGSQSFLRILNTGTNFGTVNVQLINPNTGGTFATWTSANIAVGAGIQVPITTIEAGAASKPDFYTVLISGNMIGEFSHVLWHAADGTLTNLTTCSAGTHNNPWRLGAVHTSRLGALGYPSTVVVANTGTTATRVSLDIADAGDGTKLGTYQTASIPAGGQAVLAVTDIEAGASPKIDPGSRSHYVISASSAFSGYLQHELNNAAVGVITDMTTTCSLQP